MTLLRDTYRDQDDAREGDGTEWREASAGQIANTLAVRPMMRAALRARPPQRLSHRSIVPCRRSAGITSMG